MKVPRRSDFKTPSDRSELTRQEPREQRIIKINQRNDHTSRNQTPNIGVQYRKQRCDDGRDGHKVPIEGWKRRDSEACYCTGDHGELDVCGGDPSGPVEEGEGLEDYGDVPRKLLNKKERY